LKIIETLEWYLNRIAREPDAFELFNNAGVLLYRLGDYKNSKKYFMRAYELNPLDSDILYNYALMSYQEYEWEDASALYQAYLHRNTDDKEAFEALLDCYYILGNYESAVKIQKILSKRE
jgi:tetratricopeptide (TPR) repeat protein